MKRNNNGFALIESLLIILIVVIIGFGGYYVWHTQKETDKTNSDTLKASQSVTPSASTSSSEKLSFDNGSITLNLPAGWEESPINATNGCQTANTDRGSDDLPCLGGALLLPKSAASDPKNLETINVSTYTLVGGPNPKDWFFNTLWGSSPAQGDTSKSITINGYDAYYYEQEASADGAYTDENYSIVHNNKVVYIWSRVKEVSNNTDFTKNIPLIKNLADSTQIN